MPPQLPFINDSCLIPLTTKLGFFFFNEISNYVAEDSNQEFRASVINADNPHTCSRGHHNEYVLEDYIDWS
jgi:hypothetical protein